MTHAPPPLPLLNPRFPFFTSSSSIVVNNNKQKPTHCHPPLCCSSSPPTTTPILCLYLPFVLCLPSLVLCREEDEMGMSILVLATIFFLDFLALLLAVGAERRRSTGRVVPDEYDERTFCSYDSDASTVYGLSAFGLLLLSQLVITVATKCLCCGKGLAGSKRHVSCAIVSFVFSWLIFLGAEICLLFGSAKNAYHTKYVGYYAKRDLLSCAALRKGVFAVAAALIIVSYVMSLFLYWSHSRADTGGWKKHMNEGGVGVTGFKNRDDDVLNSKA